MNRPAKFQTCFSALSKTLLAIMMSVVFFLDDAGTKAVAKEKNSMSKLNYCAHPLKRFHPFVRSFLKTYLELKRGQFKAFDKAADILFEEVEKIKAFACRKGLLRKGDEPTKQLNEITGLVKRVDNALTRFKKPFATFYEALDQKQKKTFKKAILDVAGLFPK